MTNVIITGASGFLGGALTHRLLADGVNVIALGRNIKKLARLKALGAQVMAFDLVDLPTDIVVPRANFLVHCAALSSPWGKYAEYEQANVIGTENALILAARAGARRFVNISSPSVYFRFADQVMLSETQVLPQPVNAYTESKAKAEALVTKARQVETITLRPRGIYGPGDNALLPRLLRATEKGPLPLMRGGVAATDLTFVEDVVDAILAAMSAPSSISGEIFNISGGEALPLKLVAERVAEQAGIRIRWIPLPWNLVKAYALTSERVCAALKGYPEPTITAYSAGLFAFRQTLNIEKAECHLHWRPKTTFEEGIARTFDGRIP